MSALKRQSQPEELQGTIFVSHSSNDKKLVREFAMKVVAHGGSPWVDERQLGPGTSLPTELKDVIQQSATFVYVASENSKTSDWMKRELAFAEELGADRCRIVVLKVSGTDISAIPDQLRENVYVDLSLVSLDQAARQIQIDAGEEQVSPSECDTYLRFGGEYLHHQLEAIIAQGRAVRTVHLLRADYSLLQSAHSAADVQLDRYRSAPPGAVRQLHDQLANQEKTVRRCIPEVSRLAESLVAGVSCKNSAQQRFRSAFLNQAMLILVDYCEWVADCSADISIEVSGPFRERLPAPFRGEQVIFTFPDRSPLKDRAPEYVEGRYLIGGMGNQALAEFLPRDLGLLLGHREACEFISGRTSRVTVPIATDIRVGRG